MGESRIERLKRMAKENPEGTDALLYMIENINFEIIADICENCNLSPNEKVTQIIAFWKTCETEIAIRMIGEYIEKCLPIKYERGAPHGWRKGIAYRHELGILRECIDWFVLRRNNHV